MIRKQLSLCPCSSRLKPVMKYRPGTKSVPSLYRYKEIYEVDVNFARYIDSFLEYTDIDVNIDDTDAVALFKTDGWTLNYKINSMEQEINNINTLAVFDSNAYYFAYNNVLSKDIGLDMKYIDEGIYSSGDQFWNCYMVYESPQTGWKIFEFGH